MVVAVGWEAVDTGTAVGNIHVVDALSRNTVIVDGEGVEKGVRLVWEVVDGRPGGIEVDIGKEYACVTVILEMEINDGEVVGLCVPVSLKFVKVEALDVDVAEGINATVLILSLERIVDNWDKV